MNPVYFIGVLRRVIAGILCHSVLNINVHRQVTGHDVVVWDTDVTFDLYHVWIGQLAKNGVSPFGDVSFHLRFVSGQTHPSC